MGRTITKAMVLAVVLAVSFDALLAYHIVQLRNQLSALSEGLSDLEKSFETLKAFIEDLNYDEYGGFSLLKGRKTGFFHVERIDGKYWLVDPEGNLFISKGVNHVSYWSDYAPTLGHNPYNRAVSAKYGSSENWASETVKRLWSWGFNTIGAWSSDETFTKGMPYTVILNIAVEAGADWVSGNVTDYFSERFEKAADEVAWKTCAPRRDDRHLVGYFTDNELRWTADWRSRREIFDDYLLLPSEAEGKKALVNFLEGKYIEIQALNQAWNASFSSFEDILFIQEALKNEAVDSDRLGFLEVVSRRYFKVCHDAIRKHDPNHLILGCRFAFKPPDEALKGCIGYVDVVSMSCYTNPYSEDLRNRVLNLEAIHNVTGLPVIASEFSFKAMDSGLPNTKGAGVAVKTQSERAKYYEEFVRAMVLEPFVVGYHWFQYADQPAEGRFDGENSNYGLVNIRDEPWKTLVQRATAMNFQAEALHSGSPES